jgi:hypothetical protein
MHSIPIRTALLGLLFCTPLCAQQRESPIAKPKAARTSMFLQSSPLDLALIIERPPRNNSAVTIAELKQLHDIEKVRTVQEANEAKADDVEQDIFAYRSILLRGTCRYLRRSPPTCITKRESRRSLSKQTTRALVPINWILRCTRFAKSPRKRIRIRADIRSRATCWDIHSRT